MSVFTESFGAWVSGISINSVIMMIMMIFMLVGAIDKIMGNKFGYGEEFENGFNAIGPLALSMAGVVAAAPVLATLLEPVLGPIYSAIGADPSMFATTILACDCPKLIAPAMNTRMYENPVTQENLNTLRRYGWEIIEPATGRLACGATGKGKMPEPEALLEAVDHAIRHEKDLKGVNVLVTAGPTQEALDPVRFLTNHSTGRMGYAIARAAAARGAQVTLVSGPVDLPPPAYVETVHVVSALEMFEAVKSRAAGQDILIKTAT